MTTHDAIPKIFRATLVLFALTLGLGTYALVGAPIMRIDFGAKIARGIVRVENLTGTVFSALPVPDALSRSGAVTVTLTPNRDDLQTIKSDVLSNDFGTNTTRELKLADKAGPLGIAGAIAHVSGEPLSESFARHLGGYRYFVKHDDSAHGVLYIVSDDAKATFAALLPTESEFIKATLGLVRPTWSASEVRSHAREQANSRTINGFDARVLLSANDTPLWIAAFDGDTLIVTGTEEDFIAATTHKQNRNDGK